MKLPFYDFAGFTNGALKMTRRLRMSISQKLASWKGSAEDVKAGLKPLCPLWLYYLCLRVSVAIFPCNPRNPWLENSAYSAFSAVNKIFFVPLCLSGISTLVVSALQIQPFLCKTNPISESPNERKYS